MEGRTYLVPHDAVSDAGELDTGRLITAAELQAALADVQAQDRLLLFDSNYLDVKFADSGTHVLHASGPGMAAVQGRQYGRFTAVVLQALQGWGDADQDGRVSVLELAGLWLAIFPPSRPLPSTPSSGFTGRISLW